MGAYASVAQLDRASDSDSEGRGFESRQMHQIKNVQVKHKLTCTFLLLSHHIKMASVSLWYLERNIIAKLLKCLGDNAHTVFEKAFYLLFLACNTVIC